MVRATYQQAPSEEISLQRRRGGENTGGERREERRGAKVPFLCILSLNGSNLILICNFIVVSLKQKRKKKNLTANVRVVKGSLVCSDW